MFSARPYLTTHRPSPTAIDFTVSTAPRLTTLPQKFLYYTSLSVRLFAGICILLLIFLSIFTPSSQQAASDSVHQSRLSPFSIPQNLIELSDTLRSRFLPQIYTTHQFLLPLTLLLPLLALLRRPHKAESLLVLRSLGIQISSQSSWYNFLHLLPFWQTIFPGGSTSNSGGVVGGAWGGGETRFIPTKEVRDIFIHEAFRGWEVRYYLGIVVDGEDEGEIGATGGRGGVVVVFPVSTLQPNKPADESLQDRMLMYEKQNILPGRAIVEQVWREARECLYEPRAKE